MGSYFSSSSSGRTDDPDPVTGLTSRKKHLITVTWSHVQKDMVRYGTELLFLYFSYHPQYQNYFPFRDVPLEELHQNRKFQGHCTSVIYSLAAVVENINKHDILVQLLSKNGESHGLRGIPEKAYWDLKPVVVEVLRKNLGSKFTKEAEEAWDETLDVAFKVIISNLKA